MPDSPEGYQPYRRAEFPPKILGYLANGVAVALSILTIVYYQPSSMVAFLTGALFALWANLYLHESIHYVIQSRLGYEPVFGWPNRVWVPNKALSVREGVFSLLSPQALTILYLGLLPFSNVRVVDFMIVLALIFNLVGGIRDIAWVIRRVSWPKGNLVLVDTDGREFVSFPE